MAARKVLFISEINPFSNIIVGGTVGGQKNYEALKRYYGAENVYLALITNENVEETDHLMVLGKHHNRKEYFINTLMLWNCYNRRSLNKIMEYSDMHQIRELFFDGSIFGRVVKKAKERGKIAYVYFHNVEKDYARILVKKGGIKYFSQYFSYWYNERLSTIYGDKLIALNDRDSNLIFKYYKKKVDTCVPVTYPDRFDTSYSKKQISEKKVLLFVGSAGLQANVDSIIWFADKVCSKLDSNKYILNIVGRGFEKYKKELQSDTINVIGTVAKIDQFYYEADIVVSPILYGCGMKTKTAEAMMFGKTIVASSEALVGYEYQNVEGIYKCDTSDEYIYILSKLFEDKKLDNFKSVRSLFLSKYEEQQTEKAYNSIFNSYKKSYC